LPLSISRTSVAKRIRILFLRYSYTQKTNEQSRYIPIYSYTTNAQLILINFNQKNMPKNRS